MVRKIIRRKSKNLAKFMTVRAFAASERDLGPERGSIPVIAFPTQDGMSNQWEDFGMIETLAPFIESGQISVYCVDTVDVETWSARLADKTIRAERQEAYFRYITEELVPLISGELEPSEAKTGFGFCQSLGKNKSCEAIGLDERQRSPNKSGMTGESLEERRWDDSRRLELVSSDRFQGARNNSSEGGPRILLTGCSCGGMHSAICLLRRPDLFSGMLALSGAYNARYFVKGYLSKLWQWNSGVDILKIMPEDDPRLEMLRHRSIACCCGQGLYEDIELDATHKLEQDFKDRNIDAWVDYWGTDVSHDWLWWKAQITYFLPFVLNEIKSRI